MKAGVEPLVNDGFAGEATKRALGYLQIAAGKREKYCGNLLRLCAPGSDSGDGCGTGGFVRVCQ